MATRDNLIATYQSNPTLQSRYTQQQYLDLFGFGAQQPTPTPGPTPTPPPSEGIQNIIGQNLNQGGGGGGGITQLGQTFTSGAQPRGPKFDPSINPAAQLTGRGRLDPMGSGFYDTLNRLEARNPSRNYTMSTFNENFSPSGEVIKDTSIDFNPDTNPNIRKAFFESVYEEPQKPSLINRGITAAQDFFSGLGLGTPKVRGTLGTRLANQPQLPSVLSAIGLSRNPLNPASKNFNPAFEGQLNYLEGQDGYIGRDQQSGGLKYGSESVLAGQNVISGFGTNDYLGQLNKYQDKVTARYDKLVDKFGEESDEATKYYDKFVQKVIDEKKKFTDSAIYKAQQEAEATARILEEERRRQIATTPGRKTAGGGREVATDAGAVAGAQQDISNYQSFNEVPLADGGRVYLYNRLK